MAGCCLLYTSDAADETYCVDLGGRRIIKKNKQEGQLTLPNTMISQVYSKVNVMHDKTNGRVRWDRANRYLPLCPAYVAASRSTSIFFPTTGLYLSMTSE